VKLPWCHNNIKNNELSICSATWKIDMSGLPRVILYLDGAPLFSDLGEYLLQCHMIIALVPFTTVATNILSATKWFGFLVQTMLERKETVPGYSE